MLNKLFDYFEGKITSSALDDKIEQSEKEQTLILAATALMIEVARSDENKAPVELEVISQILVSSLGVDPKESQLILDAAQEQSEEAHDLFQFTGLINQNFSREEKENLIYFMWKVAFADGSIDKYEYHIIRRISDLINLSHSDFIRLKINARDD